jgi:hypothetical protein
VMIKGIEMHCTRCSALPSQSYVSVQVKLFIIKQNKVVVRTFPEDTRQTTKKFLFPPSLGVRSVMLISNNIHNLRLLVYCRPCVGAMSSRATFAAAANTRERLAPVKAPSSSAFHPHECDSATAPGRSSRRPRSHSR